MDELVARAQQGDRAAIEQLLERVAPALYRFGRQLCGNSHDADDVLQDTLITIADRIGEFEGRSSLASWAFTVARNACAARRRGLKNQAPVSEANLLERGDGAPDPESRVAEQELAQGLATALAALPEEYREVISLRDIEDLSAPETAAVLGISVDAVKSRLHRARKTLRDLLRPWLEPAPVPARASCPDVMTLWSRKLEHELSSADCATMERHLAGCESCRAACNALKSALLACRNAADADVPAAVQERVKGAVRAWASRHHGKA